MFEPYELMKLRLLNGSHQAMCYFAYLCGYRLVHEAAQDPLFRAFLLGYMDSEATPTLAPVPEVDLDGYKHTLIERFSNPQIRDTVARLCAESSDRIPKFLLPVIRAQLVTGGEIRRSAAVVASWARYAEGVDEQGLRSRWSIGFGIALPGWPAASGRTLTRSSPTGTYSGTWAMRSPSSPPTSRRWPRCTSAEHGRRWSHWCDHDSSSGPVHLPASIAADPRLMLGEPCRQDGSARR